MLLPGVGTRRTIEALGASSSVRRFCVALLDASEKHENYHDQDDKSDSAGRGITPLPAV
jgi:hypothetical protein